MKRQGNLYHRIAEPENLRLAFSKAIKGKQGHSDVVLYRRNLEYRLKSLQQELLTENAQVGDYRFFTVYDPKERQICAAAFPERVLHHAIMNICEPFLESFAISDSFACRKGKGLHRAIRRVQEFSWQDKWYLKLDVYHYFNHIDHHQLLEFLARLFKDKKLLLLFAHIIDSYHTRPYKGMPIGNLISQHLANFYLGYLDHFLKEKLQVGSYLRYMDDILLFGRSREKLQSLFVQLQCFVSEKFKLAIQGTSYLIVRSMIKCGVPLIMYIL